MLRACEAKAQTLQSVALEQLAAACGANTSNNTSGASGVDVDQALSAFFLCAELGAEARAVAPFERCLSRIFQVQARASLERVGASKRAAVVNANGYIDRGFYVEAVSEILTGATDIMNAVADVALQPPTLLQVLQPIHAACSQVVLEIVRMYEVDARVAAWERRALAQARRQPGDADGDDVEADESLQMVDLFLDEASFLIRVLVSYRTFLQTICEDLDGDRGGSSFHAKLQELSGVYLILERFYVFQSVHKATAIAEAQELEPNVFVSSIVEDVSFVLNKAFFRASQWCVCMRWSVCGCMTASAKTRADVALVCLQHELPHGALCRHRDRGRARVHVPPVDLGATEARLRASAHVCAAQRAGAAQTQRRRQWRR